MRAELTAKLKELETAREQLQVFIDIGAFWAQRLSVSYDALIAEYKELLR